LKKGEKMIASFEQSVRQIKDKVAYEGFLKIAEIEFEYRLFIALPDYWLSDKNPLRIISRINSTSNPPICLSLKKKEGKKVCLTNGEYDFFLRFILKQAIFFFCEPWVRSFNEGLLTKTILNFPLKKPKISGKITAFFEGLCNIPLEKCPFLSQEISNKIKAENTPEKKD